MVTGQDRPALADRASRRSDDVGEPRDSSTSWIGQDRRSSSRGQTSGPRTRPSSSNLFGPAGRPSTRRTGPSRPGQEKVADARVAPVGVTSWAPPSWPTSTRMVLANWPVPSWR